LLANSLLNLLNDNIIDDAERLLLGFINT